MRSFVRPMAVLALVLLGPACDDESSGGSESACNKGSHPDCIDPDGDGKYEYLKNGERCMKELGDSGLCSDLDDDGIAGYPDSG